MLISGEKMLISAKLKGCVTWFIHFLDIPSHCRICVADFRPGAAPKKPILNRVKQSSDDEILSSPSFNIIYFVVVTSYIEHFSCNMITGSLTVAQAFVYTYLITACSRRLFYKERKEIKKEFYWNHASALVCSCKFAVYFQYTSGQLLLNHSFSTCCKCMHKINISTPGLFSN